MKITHLSTFVLCLPLALTACSGSSAGGTSSEPSSVTPAASLPAYATSFVVRAKDGVSDKDLKNAMTSLARFPGVVGVSLPGAHQLRVDLTQTKLTESKELVSALRKLGTVTVPK